MKPSAKPEEENGERADVKSGDNEHVKDSRFLECDRLIAVNE